MGSYTFVDLQFVLNTIFFKKYEGEISGHKVRLNMIPNVFNDFSNGLIQERIGYRPERQGPCICEHSLCEDAEKRNSWQKYQGCSGRLGRAMSWDTSQLEIVEDAHRLVHYYRIIEKVISEGSEGHTTQFKLNRDITKILNKYYVKSKVVVRRHNLFSCSPNIRIGISEGEVQKMSDFCQKFLTNQYFEKIEWVVESGKHENSPNLHFHFLGLYNENGSHNFRERVLIKAWNKWYPANTLDWERGEKVGIHVKACCTQLIQDDALKYFKNGKKGSHKNFVDLKKSGGFGFLD